MPIGARAGHRVYWQWFGEDADPPALFLHPALGHSGMWAPLAHKLPLKGIAFDMPGHGKSDLWMGGDYHTACTEIAETFLDRPMDLVGHSFGATLALRLALRHPDLVRSLTLIEPVLFAAARAAGAPEVAGYTADFAPYLAAMACGDHRAAARVFIGLWGVGPFDSLPESQQAALVARMPLIVASTSATDHDSAQMLAPGRLESVACAVALVRGAQSPPIIAAIHRALRARLPDTHETVVPGAAHMVPLSHPAEVARAVRDVVRL